jgi:hypothetical protein
MSKLLLRISLTRWLRTQQPYGPSAEPQQELANTPIAGTTSSARAAESGADPREFALQHGREICDDQNERTNDEAEQHYIFRHRCAVLVVTQLFEELPDLRHNILPIAATFFAATPSLQLGSDFLRLGADAAIEAGTATERLIIY